jgi:hypothetical protein
VTHPSYRKDGVTVKSYTNYWACPYCGKTLAFEVKKEDKE